MQVTIEELAMMIGQKDIQIFSLEKQLIAAHQRIAELSPKHDVQPELKAVS
jgi:hypothetical protein